MHRSVLNIAANILAAALAFILFSCAGTNQWATKINWQDFSFESLPEQDEYPDEGAVILLDEGKIEIFNKDGFAFSLLKRHRIVKIFNKRGYSYANVTIPYSQSTQISNIKARTITPDGKIIPLNSDQIFDITLYPSFIFYSDIRAKRFTLPAIEDGCVIEYRWEKQIQNFSYWDQWTFQHDVPTKISRYKVTAPSEWNINWKTIGIDLEPQTREVPRGFKQTYLWQTRDIPTLRPEFGMPPAKRVAASIIFSPVQMNHWQDIAMWYRDLIKERVWPNAALEQFTRTLVQNCITEKEKLKRIYDFVRDRIRYVAISIGIGGYQPHFARDVFHNRYGDCKDKVALIMAMASSVGIDVEPVMISTFQNGKVDTSVASYIHFNHVIAHATVKDSEDVWMDATDRNCAFSQLPWYDQNRLVFVVDAKGSGYWLRTPTTTDSINKTERRWRIQITPTDRCSVRFDMKFSGANALIMRRQLDRMRKDEIKAFFQRDLIQRFPDLNLHTLQINNLTDYESPLMVSGEFECPLPLSNLGSYSVDMKTFSQFDWQKLFTEDRRKFPIELGYAQKIVDDVQFSFPDSFSIAVTMTNDSIISDFGSYHRRCSKTNRTLRLSRRFRITATDISADDYGQFKDFLNKIALSDQATFVLIKKSG